MPGYRVLRSAEQRIRGIHQYTLEHWGEKQANDYIEGLFERFCQISRRNVTWTPIPAEFEVDGFYLRYKKHFIYWKVLSNGDVGIVTVLHERMHQTARFKEDRNL